MIEKGTYPQFPSLIHSETSGPVDGQVSENMIQTLISLSHQIYFLVLAYNTFWKTPTKICGLDQAQVCGVTIYSATKLIFLETIQTTDKACLIAAFTI